MDVTLTKKEDAIAQQEALVKTLAVVRVKFRWPGRGAPIKNQFNQELLQAMKKTRIMQTGWRQ